MGTSISQILQVTTSAVGVAPGPAGTPVISAVTSSGLTLTWTAPLSGSSPLSYTPQFRVQGSTTWVNAIATPQSGLTYTFTGLLPATTYQFQVVTSSPFPPSSNSPIVSQSTLAVVPGPPVLSAAVTVTTTTAALSWSAPTTGSAVASYSVLYKLHTDTSYTTFGTTTSTTATVTGLAAGTQYDFEVSATNSAGTGPVSNIVTTTTAAGVQVPSAPQNVQVTSTTSSSLSLSWSAPAVGTPSSYTVNYTPAGGATATATGVVGLTYTITGLQPNTAYTVAVLAVNSAGSSTPSAPATGTTAAGAVRSPFLQPGGNAGVCPWNTPIGSGAVFSAATDKATVSLTSKSNTVNCASFGQNIYVATAADPLTTFTSSNGAGTQRDPNLTVTIHCPSNAVPTAPYPGGDCQITVYDTTLTPAIEYCFGGCAFVNGKDASGGFTASSGESNLICGSMADALTGNFGYDSGVGTIRAWELDSVQNPSGRIRHVLRFACDVTQLLPPTAWDVPTNPTARTLADGSTLPAGAVQIYWPQTHTDFNAPTAYTGYMPAGALCAIPSGTAQPAGLSAGGKMLFDQMMNYGIMWRDTASGGVTLYGEPGIDQNSLIVGMRGDLNKLVPLLRIVTNVGPSKIGGGGTPIDASPAPPVDPGICGAATIPGPPTALATTSQTSSSIALSWATGSGTLPQNFTVQSSPTGAGTWTTAATGVAANAYTVTGLTASTAYDFRVSATNTAGTGAYSTILSNISTTAAAAATTLDPTSSTLTLSNNNLSASNKSATSGTMQTARTTTGITSTGGLRQFEFTMNTSTTDVGYGIVNQSYVFNQASGLGGDGNGVGFYPTINQGIYCGSGIPISVGAANSPNGEVITCVFDPSVPQIWFSTATMRAAGNTWNNSATANPSTGVGGVNLSGKLTTGTYYAAVNDDQINGLSTLNTGASTFTVALATGIVAWDNTATGGGGTPPGQVTGLVVASPTASTLALNWAAPSTGSAVSSYTVQRATAAGGPFSTVKSGVTATSYTDGSLNPSTKYFYQVSATNPYGTGPYSAVANGTTSFASSTGGLLSSGPLKTSGNQIVDAAGVNQRIACADWAYGYDRPPTLFGLNAASYKDNLDSMKAEGFNCVRLHTCDAGVIAGDKLATTSFSATLNPDLVGLTLLQVYQKFMDYGATIGMRFIVDSHSNEGNLANQGNGLWYDSGGASNNTDGSGNVGTVTDANFVSSWQTRATAFAGKSALLGYDLRNEPASYNGMCTWGGMAGATAGSNTDIRDMYQRVGNAIHAIDSNLPLIFCEGPQNYTGSFSGATGLVCPEGDLTGVASYPVTLTNANKVVYSVHSYPASVAGTGVGSDTGTTAITRWMSNWGTVFKNGSPIWVGECGDVLGTTADQAWATTFVSFMNGSATGGIALSGSQQGPGFGWWTWATQADATAGGGSQFAITTAYKTGAIQSGQAPTIQALQFKPSTTGPAPLVVSPLSGTIAAGTWTLKQISGMYYWELLPSGYSTAASYPLVLCLHQLDQGNPFYSGGKVASADIVKPQWDPWVNNPAFRKAHPCIVLLPLLDQTTDTGGNTINWGGVSAGDPAGETTCIALVQYYIQNFSVFPGKVFVTGNSMGGIGSWDMIIKWNTKNPLRSKIFAGALILAGADYAFNYPTPDATMVSNMLPVPIWSIHGAQDTQVPLDWDRNMYAKIGTSGSGGGLTPAALVGYLNSIAGTSTISGQFVELSTDPTNGIAAITEIHTQTGYWLGHIQGDYFYFGQGGTTANTAYNAAAISYWNNQGLVSLITSWPNPTTGGGSPDTSSLNVTDLFTAGTPTYINFWATAKSIGNGLLALQNAGVTAVPYRMFHEMNGNWFWWGTGFLTDAQFVTLWKSVHDYFVNTLKLTNVVWWWTPNAGIGGYPSTAARYPGDNYVDMLGFDLYTSSPSDAADVTALNNIAAKPVWMSEFGPGSPSSGDTSFNEGTLVDTIGSAMPSIVGWVQWWDGNGGGTGWGMRETSSWADVKTALGKTRVINRPVSGFFNGGGGTVVPLGAYLGNIDGTANGTPNTIGYYPGFDTQFDNFKSVMGRAPTLYEVYYDVTISALGANGWANYTNYLTGIIAGDTRTKGCTPILGWPLGNTADGCLFYPTNKITNGTYDTEIKNALANWKAGGYPTLYIRPNWEFNLNNPYGLTSANQSAFISSWQYFYNLVQNYAGANQMTVKIVWNPNVGTNQNTGASPNAVNVSSWYPGDAYVDVYGIDTYGSPVDSAHTDPSVTTTDPTQYLVTTMMAMAKASGKNVSFCEVGGLDNTFATNMVNYLKGLSPNGTPAIEFFALWSNDDLTSGNLSWTNTWDNQKTLQTTWKGGFGPTGTVTNLSSGGGATGGHMKYTEDANLGHDVWDTYYVEPTSETYWSWLFGQSA